VSGEEVLLPRWGGQDRSTETGEMLGRPFLRGTYFTGKLSATRTKREGPIRGIGKPGGDGERFHVTFGKKTPSEKGESFPPSLTRTSGKDSAREVFRNGRSGPVDLP